MPYVRSGVIQFKSVKMLRAFLFVSLVILVDCTSEPLCKKCPENERHVACVGCENTCANPDIAARCRAICKPGCVCREGWFRNSKGTCVPPEKCDSCRPGEVFSSSGNTECVDTCAQPNRSKTCKPERPIAGCICAKGLIRNKNGVCVDPRACNIPLGPKRNVNNWGDDFKRRFPNKNEQVAFNFKQRPPGPNYKPDNVLGPQNKRLMPPQHFVLNNKNIKPPQPLGSNNKHMQLPQDIILNDKHIQDIVLNNNHIQPPQDIILNNEHIQPPQEIILDKKHMQNPQQLILNNKHIQPFRRPILNKNGLLPPKDSIWYNRRMWPPRHPICKGPNEIFKCNDTPCQITCATLGDPCDKIPIKCVEGCYCKNGFARDADGICIPIEECLPRQCPTDPHAIMLPCGDPCPTTCDNIDDIEPKSCNEICIKNGCKCKEGYVLGKDGKCVLVRDCPPKHCSKDLSDIIASSENKNPKKSKSRCIVCNKDGCKRQDGSLKKSLDLMKTILKQIYEKIR